MQFSLKCLLIITATVAVWLGILRYGLESPGFPWFSTLLVSILLEWIFVDGLSKSRNTPTGRVARFLLLLVILFLLGTLISTLLNPRNEVV